MLQTPSLWTCVLQGLTLTSRTKTAGLSKRLLWNVYFRGSHKSGSLH